jgi:hypothetical protein
MTEQQTHNAHSEPKASEPKAETPPLTGPQAKAPTPLDQPEIYYNLTWRVPPLVVHTQEQKDALDPNEWTLDPSIGPKSQKAAAHYPKLYYNINVPPVVVGSAEDVKLLGGAYTELAISQELVRSAQATLDDAAKASKQTK